MFWYALLLVGLGGAVQCPNSGVSNRTSSKMQLNGIWREVSGVAVSTQSFNGEPLVWVHDDSGGVHSLGLFGMFSGILIQKLDLPSSPEIPFEDPEDLAVGACGASWLFPGSGECIYLGDMGDNSKVRNNLRIYKMREPFVAALMVGATTLVELSDIQVLRFVYDTSLGAPTTHSDCETLFVDSVGQEAGEAQGDIYLLTKWMSEFANVRLFRYPNSMQDGNTIVHLQVASDAASLKTTGWTRGDMSRDGSLVVIGGYSTTKLFQREKGTSIVAMFNASGLCAGAGLGPPLSTQLQQEASALTPAPPFALVDIGECNSGAICNASLFYTPLVTRSSSLTPSLAPSSTANHASTQCVHLPLLFTALFLIR